MASLEQIVALPNGARFYRADLHIHSYGGSYDVKDVTMTPDGIVQAAIAEGLEVISITDHQEISNVEAAMKAAAGKNLLVIPGIELSTPQGHLLCYLPTYEALQTFYGRLNLIKEKRSSHCQDGMTACMDHLSSLGGFAILAHVDGDGGFELALPGGASPHRKDVICHEALAGIELLSLASNISYSSADTEKTRAALGAERIKRLGLGELQHLARILNSDCHAVKMLGRNSKGEPKVSRIKMDSPSFEAVRIALDDADARIRIEEEIPKTVPYIEGISAEGGFLDGVQIHFSPNLNCIIGGRGTGKSTTFEGLRCLIADAIPSDTVDSDVWPDSLKIYWRDQAGQSHELHRPINGDVANLQDAVSGPVSFQIESYGQGETTHISHSAKEDPTALLSYLDRFIEVAPLEQDENEARDKLLELWGKLDEARNKVAKIPNYVRDLDIVGKQLAALASANAEEVIKLQRSLEEEREVRSQIAEKLAEMGEDIEDMDLSEDIEEIESMADPKDLAVGTPEFKGILAKAKAYKLLSKASSKKSSTDFAAFRVSIDAELAAWKSKEKEAEKKIDVEKKRLAAQNIRLDMAFIAKLANDETQMKAKLKVLRTWEPVLKTLEKEYVAASKWRWAAREKVALSRVGYATVASETLKSVLKDLQVSLKFLQSSYSPEAEKQIIEAMGWRTSQVPRAALLISTLTLPKLIEAIYKKDARAIASVKTEQGVAAFTVADVRAILDNLSNPSVLFALERSSVYDLPKLTVTAMVSMPDGTKKAVMKDFTKLSLGQQQSILLALMLSSKSNAPLIIDQPEDHLDSEFIYRTLVPVLRQAKERRQVIVVTHNPNIAVLGDAEQIIVLKSTNAKSRIVGRGSIDDPATRDITCDVLEGAKEAFAKRARIYGVA